MEVRMTVVDTALGRELLQLITNISRVEVRQNGLSIFPLCLPVLSNGLQSGVKTPCIRTEPQMLIRVHTTGVLCHLKYPVKLSTHKSLVHLSSIHYPWERRSNSGLDK